MTEATPSPLELMRLHVEAGYTHDSRSRLESVNDFEGGVAPRFYLGRTTAGNLWRFRTDLPDDLADELENLCISEPETTEPSQMPTHHEEYVQLLAPHAPIESIWSGPGYWFEPEVISAAPSAEVKQSVEIYESNADLLRGGLEDWLECVPHWRPFIVSLEDGHAVSVCASVRITEAAHEAGVETVQAYRRRGHAVSAVASWAAAVEQTGAIPLYSTSWNNTASQSVAGRLGLSMFGVDFHIR